MLAHLNGAISNYDSQLKIYSLFCLVLFASQYIIYYNCS